MENKEAILKRIKEEGFIGERFSRTVGDSFYNPYFLLRHFKTLKELELLSEKELNLLLELASFVSDAFY